MINQKALAILLSVLAVSLLLVGPVLAQDPDVEVAWDEGTMPAAPAGAVTDRDNENNAGGGVPDNDMGLRPWADQYVCGGDAIHPVEFRIASSDGDAELWIAAWDVDPAETMEVYFNGAHVGDLVEAADTQMWTLSFFPVTATGNDLVEVVASRARCVGVPWGALVGLEPEFVPEPGTVILLASGLMGMAGYAGLRLRKK